VAAGEEEVVAAVTAKIEVRNLTVRYGPREALNGVSLAIPARAIFGVIGPANSGKTTLLKCINRTLELIPGAAAAGEVFIDGQDTARIGDVHELRRRIGMVFPLPVGLPLSVYDNVAYAPRMAGVRARAALDEIVERCLGRRRCGTRSRTVSIRSARSFPAASSSA
jgi:phosphate transport system ATP-binding protein